MGKFLIFCRIQLKFHSWLYKKRWHTSWKYQFEKTSIKNLIAKKPLTNLYEMNSRFSRLFFARAKMLSSRFSKFNWHLASLKRGTKHMLIQTGWKQVSCLVLGGWPEIQPVCYTDYNFPYKNQEHFLTGFWFKVKAYLLLCEEVLRWRVVTLLMPRQNQLWRGYVLSEPLANLRLKQQIDGNYDIP